MASDAYESSGARHLVARPHTSELGSSVFFRIHSHRLASSVAVHENPGSLSSLYRSDTAMYLKSLSGELSFSISPPRSDLEPFPYERDMMIDR